MVSFTAIAKGVFDAAMLTVSHGPGVPAAQAPPRTIGEKFGEGVSNIAKDVSNIARDVSTIARDAADAARNHPIAAASMETIGERFGEGVSNIAKDAADAAKNHPLAAAAMGSGLLVAAAPAVVVAPALAVAGFGPVGIGMYTAAAWWHGTIGNAVAGSIFATLTSAGMGGAAGVAAVNGVVSGAAGAVTAGGALGGALSSWMEGNGPESKDKKSCS